MHQNTTEFEQSLADLEQSLREDFPGGVPRNRIGKATGDILHPRTCSNEDSLGYGIKGRFKVGRNTIYPIPGIIERIRQKTKIINLKSEGNYENKCNINSLGA
jgi:hypothetical protein